MQYLIDIQPSTLILNPPLWLQSVPTVGKTSHIVINFGLNFVTGAISPRPMVFNSGLVVLPLNMWRKWSLTIGFGLQGTTPSISLSYLELTRLESGTHDLGLGMCCAIPEKKHFPSRAITQRRHHPWRWFLTQLGCDTSKGGMTVSISPTVDP